MATFHDATPFKFPSPRSAWQRFRARLGIRSLHRATLVHAVSRYAADELVEHVGVPRQRVRVVYWGVGPPFRPAIVPSPPRHLLFVGGCEPHKNLDVVVRALLGSQLPPLVVVGPGASDPRAVRLLRPLAEQGLASLATAVGDDELAALYRQALATLVPSRNEGFGLPALEAMACGCPVIASDRGALPEVCLDAALLADPDDPASWREAIGAVHSDPGRRTAMAQAGLARAQTLSWERCAMEMKELYREAARLASS